MNQITDPPLNSDFGYDFNYAVWTEGTRVSLVNVPWNNDYRDVVKFASRSALNAYITSQENADYVIEDIAYAKAGMPIRIDLPFNKVYRFNYLRASNPAQPVPGSDVSRDFYYFITDVRYLAPNTTEIVVQLDVFQTFIYDVTFGNCYIERGHIGIANENAFSSFGRDYLTIPEGLDTGSEYQVIYKRDEYIMKTDGTDGVGTHGSDIVVASTVDLLADPGTVEAPKLESAKGSYFNQIPSGASLYFWRGGNNFLAWLGSMAQYPWVTQGIINITMVPPITRYLGSNPFPSPETIEPIELFSRTKAIKYAMRTNWREHSDILGKIPERYRHLRKFFTYPYMVIEITTFTGQPIIVKPEAWNDPNATIIERANLIPPGQRVVFHPFKYNALTGSPTDDQYPIVPPGATNDGGDDWGDYLDIGTQISNLPTLAIVNNGAIAYLAGNANSLAYQRQSADWAQTRALRGNEVAYDQASGAMQAARTLTDISNTADYAQTMLGNANMFNQAGISALGGIVGGGVQGGIGGATAGPGGAAIGAGIGMVGNTVGGLFSAMGNNITAETAARSQSIRAATNMAGNNVANRQGELVRDTNKDLSDWAARGDYENSIAGINAKVQDAQLIQPNVSGQMGGELLNLVNNQMKLSVRWKMLDIAAMTVIGEYWLRYGYAVRRFATIPATLMTMTKFTYWKLLETYISGGPMPEGFKQAIRGIFEKGVTVWADPADIGNVDLADNKPVEGITL